MVQVHFSSAKEVRESEQAVIASLVKNSFSSEPKPEPSSDSSSPPSASTNKTNNASAPCRLSPNERYLAFTKNQSKKRPRSLDAALHCSTPSSPIRRRRHKDQQLLQRGRKIIGQIERRRHQQPQQAIVKLEDISPEARQKRDEIIRTISESTPYTLSDEQIHILKTIRPPPTNVGRNVNGKDSGGCIIRVTAAAGTGKTETLLKLAQLAAGLDHELITYVTFNKAAAQDGYRRLASVMKHPHQLNARTLHSCAMKLLEEHRKSESDKGEGEGESAFMDDAKLSKKIEKLCETEIESFLHSCYRTIESMRHPEGAGSIAKMKKNARTQVCFYLMKNLTHFAMSDWSFKKFCNSNTFNRVYFPAKKYHAKGGPGEKCGFVGYHTKIDWYANTAATLWQMLDEKQIRTFNLEMKRAQLLGLQVPGTCILVDESQDCDACQISWLAKQTEFGSQVYFVGDSAQTIYSFRGAKSSILMKLPASKSCTLTKSWRFGPAIARIANLVLFAKEKSPQTIGTNTPTWDPYRVKGNGNPHDMVTSRPIAQNWKHQKITIIAWHNSTLLVEALKLLGFSSEGICERSGGINDDRHKKENDLSSIVSQEINGGNLYYQSDQFPKFHINGKGDNSGHGKWKTVLKEIESMYELYELSQPEESDKEENEGGGCRQSLAGAIKLDPKIFREFDGEAVTWDMFLQRVVDLELNRYAASIGVIQKFERDTMRAINLFKSMVVDQKYKAEEADIILTTTHAGKLLKIAYRLVFYLKIFLIIFVAIAGSS